MQNLTLTIEEAARLLKVSTKTLRRWDTKGVLVPLRTTGSHRRYTSEQIVEFKTKIKNERKAKRERYESQPVSVFVAPQIPTPTPSIPSEPVVPFVPQPPVIQQRQPIYVDTIPTFQQNNPPSSSSPPTESRNIPYKAWGLLGVSFFLILSLGFLSTLHFNSGDGESSTASNVSPEQTVLGASKGSRYGFRIGIPTLFTQNAEVLKDLTVKGVSYLTGGIDTKGADIDAGEGKITASNVVYSVEGSRGISVSGDQELTIINTDRGSSQKIFNTIKSGSASITAVTNTDAFEFVAGDNISLLLDTTNKKLTITGEEASSDTPTAQGWAFDTDVIYLEDSSYSVGIGTDSPSTKLHVVGNILGSGDITAGGNLNATGSIQTGGVSRITSTGALDNITTTEFNGITYSWPASDGSSGYAMVTDGSGGLSWANLGGAVTSYWTLQNGSIFPSNTTLDFLVGGATTAGAKFAVTNTAGGTPTTTLFGGSGNLVITASGNITTTGTQDITIGDASTGNITLSPTGGSGTTTANGTVNLGSASTGIQVSSAGVIIDSDGNVVIADTVDLGSTTTGIRVTGAGTISDIDGNISLSDNTDITGSLTSSAGVDFASTLFVGTSDAFQVDANGNVSTSGTTGLTFTSTGNITLAGGTLLDTSDEVDINDDLDVSGTLTSGTANAFQVDTTGNVTTSGTTGITLSGSGADMAFSGGGVMTSSGILIPQGTKDSISVRKGTKVFEIGTDFAGSLGFVRTVGKSVNLFSEGYPVYEIKRGFGKFMQAEYRECGIENTYSVDPDAIAQQTLLNLALTRGKGDVTRPTSHL